MTKKLNTRHLIWIIITAMFMLYIYVPFFMTLFSTKTEWSVAEKRRLASRPELSPSVAALQTYPSDFEDYYNDHFALRESMVKRHNRLMRRYFGKSRIHKTLIGKENWLYFTGDRLIEDLLCTDPFTAQDLEIWHANLTEKNNWLKQNNIKYLFLVAPNKQSIYPEFLPDELPRNKCDSRWDQLIKHMRAHSDVEILDLRSVLGEAKKSQRIYYRTDPHWNAIGSYTAYREIIKTVRQWFPEAQGLDFVNVRRGRPHNYSGTLAQMLQMSDTITEKSPKLEVTKRCSDTETLELKGWDPIHPFVGGSAPDPFAATCKAGSLRTVIFHDSFFVTIFPLISQNFHHTVFVWKPYDHGIMLQLIQRFKPHVVIEEMAERFLYQVKPPYNAVVAAPITGP